MSLGKEIKQTIDTAGHEALLNIVHTANQLALLSARYFARFGVTQAQYNLMIIIKLEDRSLTQVEISERMVSTRANITALIDKLEKKGYVRRVSVDGDRRVYRVKLTEAGLKKVSGIEPKYVNKVRNIMTDFPDRESRQLSALLEKVRASLKSVEAKNEK